MGIRTRILRPVGRIKADWPRRSALILLGVPACIVLQITQIVLAPVAVLAVLIYGMLRALWETLDDIGASVIAATKQEPESWRAMFHTFARIWREDRETWSARQSRIIAKPNPGDPS